MCILSLVERSNTKGAPLVRTKIKLSSLNLDYSMLHHLDFLRYMVNQYIYSSQFDLTGSLIEMTVLISYNPANPVCVLSKGCKENVGSYLMKWSLHSK
jgi:hypothetical protein